MLLASFAVLFAALFGGGMLGYRMAQESAAPAVNEEASAPLTLGQPEGRALIERVGELTGRLIRLESEAVALAKRVGVLKEFEEQVGAQAKPQRTADTAESPSGGPLLPPVGETLSALAVRTSAHDDDFGTGLAELERHMDRIDEAFAFVEQVTTERNLQNMAFPSRSPVLEPRIGSGFGNRLDPFTRKLARHTGIDFPAPKGTPIVASAGGRVRRAGYNRDYGYMIEIDHGNGLVTRYAHSSKLLVRAGELVMPQQRIALIGSTGRSTGPHLHFEVIRNGAYVDPRHYLALTASN
ncbi:M23 family metallopeptidase [Pseudothauera rhizosphaerae]|uniref:M23 family metallopeptidase n=1 Tax=Pseudothauera rhizosphaerae TaxID=2565932 RepID=UPI001E4560A4|nr:M23 family metallopeptidase [Pseudothauera rhizosphaerae]